MSSSSGPLGAGVSPTQLNFWGKRTSAFHSLTRHAQKVLREVQHKRQHPPQQQSVHPDTQRLHYTLENQIIGLVWLWSDF